MGVWSKRVMSNLPGVSVLNAIIACRHCAGRGEHSWFYSLLFNRVWETRKRIAPTQRTAEVAELPGKRRRLTPGRPIYQHELAEQLLRAVATHSAACVVRG